MCSRLLFVFVPACAAAVMSFITHSDAGRARPTTTQEDSGVKHITLRRPYTPFSQRLFTGLPSTETGLQTGANIETDTHGNYRDASSIIDRRSNSPGFTAGSFGYNQNIPDNRGAGIPGVQSEMRPGSSISTGHSQHRGQSFERQQSGVNYHPLSQGEEQSGNSYYSHPVVIRKSSHKEAAGPFHQGSRPTQVWDLRDAQSSYNKEIVPDEDETVRPPPDSSLFSPHTGRYWSTSPPTSRGHYSGYTETNEPALVGPLSTSSGIQSSRFLSFASQTAPHAPSISNSLDASVITSNPSPEKLASSITDFSRLLSSSETPRQRKVQSYLFKDSKTSFRGRETVDTATVGGHSAFPKTPHEQRPSDAQVNGWFKPSQREEPIMEHFAHNAKPLYHNMAQYGAQTGTFTKYQHNTAETSGQMSPRPTLDYNPTHHADFQGNYGTGGEKSIVNRLDNTTTRGSVPAYKPGQTVKTIYGFRGFKKEPSSLSSSGSNERANPRRYSFDKEKFKISNIYPSLSPKYSFGQRKVSTTPAKPSPATLRAVQTTPRPFTSEFKESQPPLPESDVGLDSNQDHRQFRIYRRIYGLKGFGTRPLEGAKSSVSEPERSTRVQQGFEGFKHRGSQKSSMIHRWYNITEPGSSHESKMSHNEKSEDLKPLLKTTESATVVSRFTPDTYQKNRKIYTHLGFDPVQKRTGNATTKTHWSYKDQNPATASANQRIPSAYLRSAWGLKPAPRPPSRPAEMKTSLFNTFTSSTVRGKRVRGKYTHGKNLNGSTSLTNHTGNVAIVRLPKQPVGVKAVTYADIVGSASFSGVRGITQTAPADKDYFPNIKEEAGYWTLSSHSRGNTSRGPEDEVDFSGVDTNKMAVRSEGDDSGMKTTDLFLDNEGSGSGGFNMSNVFSAETTKSLGLRKDLLELDYLRTSTGNVSFKSVKLSQTRK